jgi:transcriptional regulator
MRKQKSWSWKEIKKVWKLKDKGLNNREIGKIIGRTKASVHYIIGKTHDYF